MNRKSNWPTTSPSSRGYGYEWVKLRKRILQRDCGICQPCQRIGYIHQGTEVDHVISKAEGKRLGWAQSRIECDANLQTICHAAHVAKTAAEQGRTLKPKVTIGKDGWPV